MIREIQRSARNGQNRTMFVEVNPGIADLMYGDEKATVEALKSASASRSSRRQSRAPQSRATTSS